MQPVDYFALVTLVLDYGGLLEAHRKMAERGLVQRDVDHGMDRADPLVKVFNLKRAALFDTLRVLGFTPVSRAALGLLPPREPLSEFEKMLG